MPKRFPRPPICLFHEADYVGGGQTFINTVSVALRQIGWPVKVVIGSAALIKWQQSSAAPTGILIANIYTPEQLWPLLVWRLRGKKLVVVAHGVWYREWQSRLGRNNWRGLETWKLFLSQWLLFSLADRIITLSQYSTHLVQTSFPTGHWWQEKLVILPGMMASSSRLPKLSRVRTRTQLGLKPTDVGILAVGRLERRKGFELVCKAFGQLLQRYPQAKLVLVLDLGASAQLELLPDLIAAIQKAGGEDRVNWIFNPPKKSLAAIYRAADLCVLGSTDLETFGFVTLEALAAGLPVIGFTAGATPEILGNSLTRLLTTPTQTATALAQKIVSWFKLPLAQKLLLRQTSHQRAQFFAKSQILPKWQRFLQELQPA